ncbi:riboflavin synthase domain-like protein [Lophium mytilinum]|uniref:Riboflavin synthase domain-like protein n=1 Tax=Lophium mytilinum TaxID=390894 RepID=A0A6A6QPP9_9PEZI|nr:riboflavin synthase domain-like protein [Lophium mytilinum]
MDAVSTSYFLTVGSEDTVLLLLVTTVLLYYVAQSQIGPKHERSRLEDLFNIPQRQSHRTGASPISQGRSRNVCDVIGPSSDVGAVVFWASQGGSAEALASRCTSDLTKALSKRVITADLADYDFKHMPDVKSQALLIFVVSTYGEGDPPDNGVAFLESLCELRKRRRRLNNVRYTMFGLGNSNYTHYNKFAFDIDRLLVELGATKIGPLGLGDDREGGTEESFVSWKSDMGHQVAETLHLRPVQKGYSPRIRICPLKDSSDGTMPGVSSNVYQGEPVPVSATSNLSSNITLPITGARQLTSVKDGGDAQISRHCVHLEFSLDGCPTVTYETGDYLRIWPINPDSEVQALLHVLGVWDARKDVVAIVPIDGTSRSSIRIPTPATLEALFRYCLDICGPVSRAFLGGLSEFTTDTNVQDRLEALTGDRNVFYEKVTSKRWTLAAVLKLVTAQSESGRGQSSLDIPLSYVLENLKKLQPRSYSISSSPLLDPRAIAVTALAVSDSLKEASTDTYLFRGVTSNYLLQLQQEFGQVSPETQSSTGSYSTAGPCDLLQGGKVFARIRRSNFKPPTDPSTPIIMIGSGTGVAPFRAFVQERMKLKMQGSHVGKTMLLVGHRDADEDYYYSDLWQEANECLGEAFELFTAFSRGNQKPRQYVQDVLATKSDKVLDILAANRPAGGAMYICGSSLMANGVKTCLAEMWSQSSRKSASLPGETADEWIKGLSRLRRLQEDSWGK